MERTKRYKQVGAKKSWNELGIPSDRVAPGAPNPSPNMIDYGRVNKPRKKKKSKFNHGEY